MKLFQKFFKPKWQHSDPSIRKQALLSLDKTDSQAIFIEVATDDKSSDLRILALKRVIELKEISRIAQENSDQKVKELAFKLVQQALSGKHDSNLSEAQKIEQIRQLSDQKLFEYIAENGNTPALRKSAIENISRESLLGNLAISDNDSEIRISAAKKLSQKSTLERVFRATKTKDKNVSRIVKDTLDRLIIEAEKPAKLLAVQKQICLQIETLGSKGLWQRDKFQFDNYVDQWLELEKTESLALQPRFEEAKNQFLKTYASYLERHEERLKEEAAYLPIKEEKQTIINTLHKLLSQLEKNPNLNNFELENINSSVTEQESEWSKLAPLPEEIETEIKTQFDDALKNIKKNLNNKLKNKSALKNLEKLLRNINNHIEHPFKLSEQSILNFKQQTETFISVDTKDEIQQLKQDINNKLNHASKILEKHNSRLDKLGTETKKLLDEMEGFLNDGILKDATRLRKTIQSNIKEMEKFGVKNLRQLHDRVNNSANKMNELSNWRSWANTPQKEQLIQKIEALIDSDLDPKEIAYIISQARNSWKELGPSEKESSQLLWDKFQAACEQAYEPCKEYFSKEAVVFEENLQSRIKFLDDLESFLKQADWENIDWKKVETLFRHSRTEWQALGLTDKKKRKNLNKRFYDLYNQLKNALNAEWDKNAKIKSDIIIEAQALINIDDIQEAINGAKSLQQRWKKAGRIQHVKEREMWTQFKQASDAVFNRREDANKQKEIEAQAEVDKKDALVKKIEDYCDLSPLEIGQSRSTFKQLQSDLRQFGATNTKSDRLFEKRLSTALNIFERKIESLDKYQTVADLSRLKQQSDVCLLLENAIEAKQEIDLDNFKSQMEAIDPSTQNEWNRCINQRFTNLVTLVQQEDSITQLTQEAKKNNESKSLAAVQLEIIADINTPEEATNERLKAQTQRLTDKLQNRSEENQWDSFLAAEVNWLTIGPVLSKDLESLNRRHSNAILALKTEYPEELKDY